MKKRKKDGKEVSYAKFRNELITLWAVRNNVCPMKISISTTTRNHVCLGTNRLDTFSKNTFEPTTLYIYIYIAARYRAETKTWRRQRNIISRASGGRGKAAKPGKSWSGNYEIIPTPLQFPHGPRTIRTRTTF